MPENLTLIQEMYRRHYGVSPTKNTRHYREFLIGINSFLEYILFISKGESLPKELSKKLYVTSFFALSETSREGFIAAGNERNNLLVPILAHYNATAVYC